MRGEGEDVKGRAMLRDTERGDYTVFRLKASEGGGHGGDNRLLLEKAHVGHEREKGCAGENVSVTQTNRKWVKVCLSVCTCVEG